MKFSEFITEQKNTHMTHIEWMALSLGKYTRNLLNIQKDPIL
jgi:hypothetical protein